MAKITPSNNKQNNTTKTSNKLLQNLVDTNNTILTYLVTKRKEEKRRIKEEKQRKEEGKYRGDKEKETSKYYNDLKNSLTPNADFTNQGTAILAGSLIHPALGMTYMGLNQIGINPYKVGKSIFKLGVNGIKNLIPNIDDSSENGKSSVGAVGLTTGRYSTNKAINDGCDKIVKELKKGRKQTFKENKKESSLLASILGFILSGRWLKALKTLFLRGFGAIGGGLLGGALLNRGVSYLSGSDRLGRGAGWIGGGAITGGIMAGPYGAVIGAVIGGLTWLTKEIINISREYKRLGDQLQNYSIEDIERGDANKDPKIPRVKNNIWNDLGGLSPVVGNMLLGNKEKAGEAWINWEKVQALKVSQNKDDFNFTQSLKSYDDLINNKEKINSIRNNYSFGSRSSRESYRSLDDQLHSILKNELFGDSPKSFEKVSKELGISKRQLISLMGNEIEADYYKRKHDKENEFNKNNNMYTWLTNNPDLFKDKNNKYQSNIVYLINKILESLTDTKELASEGKFGNSTEDSLISNFMGGGSLFGFLPNPTMSRIFKTNTDIPAVTNGLSLTNTDTSGSLQLN